MRTALFVALAVLLMSSAAHAQELRLFCKTDTLAYVDHAKPGEPWRGEVSAPGKAPDIAYILRPLTPTDRSQRLELDADQINAPTHGLFVHGAGRVIGWCRRYPGTPSLLTCQAPGANALGIDEGRLRFFRSSPGSYLSDGVTAAATMELGRCSRL